jgi:hypothetical protein
MQRTEIERAHFVAWQAPGDEPVNPREAIVALTRRHKWLVSPLLRAQQHVTYAADGEGDGCRDLTSGMFVWLEVLPPVSLLLANRLRLLLAWLVFAFGLLLKGKVPIGPGSHTIAVPSRGLAGPWQRASPLAFHDPLGPAGLGSSCIDPIPRPSPMLRPLLRKHAACAPRPTAAARVVISAGGWVVRPRFEPEMYTPIDAPAKA